MENFRRYPPKIWMFEKNNVFLQQEIFNYITLWKGKCN